MKKKPKSFFAAGHEKVTGEGSARNRPNKKKAPSRKTSINPLYETTDQYRKVCKPMNVEDFLSAES